MQSCCSGSNCFLRYVEDNLILQVHCIHSVCSIRLPMSINVQSTKLALNIEYILFNSSHYILLNGAISSHLVSKHAFYVTHEFNTSSDFFGSTEIRFANYATCIRIHDVTCRWLAGNWDFHEHCRMVHREEAANTLEKGLAILSWATLHAMVGRRH